MIQTGVLDDQDCLANAIRIPDQSYSAITESLTDATIVPANPLL